MNTVVPMNNDVSLIRPIKARIVETPTVNVLLPDFLDVDTPLDEFVKRIDQPTLEACRDEFRAALNDKVAEDYLNQSITVLVASYPQAKSDTLQIYLANLSSELSNFPTDIVRDALREIRQTQKFVPSVAEVYSAVKERYDRRADLSDMFRWAANDKPRFEKRRREEQRKQRLKKREAQTAFLKFAPLSVENVVVDRHEADDAGYFLQTFRNGDLEYREALSAAEKGANWAPWAPIVLKRAALFRKIDRTNLPLKHRSAALQFAAKSMVEGETSAWLASYLEKLRAGRGHIPKNPDTGINRNVVSAALSERSCMDELRQLNIKYEF